MYYWCKIKYNLKLLNGEVSRKIRIILKTVPKHKNILSGLLSCSDVYLTLINSSGGLKGFWIKCTSSGVRGHIEFRANITDRNSNTASSKRFCKTWTRSCWTSGPASVIPCTLRMRVSSFGLSLLSFSPKDRTLGRISP